MKKTVLTFGLISGVILSAMMVLTIPFMSALGNSAMVIGYTTMVLAFLLVYFGVRSYRDNVLGGRIGFGRAFATGILITVVASTCYVVTWELMYFKLAPNVAARFRAALADTSKVHEGTPEATRKKIASMQNMARIYENPLINSAFTFIEPLAPALVMSLLTAAVLSRKKREESVVGEQAVA